MYITDCAKKRHRGLGKRACRPPSRLSVSSIGRRLAAITYAHKNAGLDSPTRHPVVARVWGGIRRKLGVAPIAKTAIETGALSKLVEPLRYSPIDVRDRAILLIGFAGAFRRSELVGLNTGDVRFVDDGVTINLRKSKTDQEGAGALVGIAYGSKLTTCPVRALQRWIELAGSDDGELPLFRPVFSSGRIGTRRLIGQSIANLVKRHCEAVKLDPDCTHKKRDPDCKHAKLDPTKFGAHSLRSGFATSAARRGMPDRKIMRQTRHKSPASLNPYIQKATVFDDNASADVGL
jgi:integrase